jgi:hypothetical protein
MGQREYKIWKLVDLLQVLEVDPSMDPLMRSRLDAVEGTDICFRMENTNRQCKGHLIYLSSTSTLKFLHAKTSLGSSAPDWRIWYPCQTGRTKSLQVGSEISFQLHRHVGFMLKVLFRGDEE